MFDPDHVDVELPELADAGRRPARRRARRGRRCRRCCAGRRTPAQAAAARPARDRRHRQHLRRRDPPRAPGCTPIGSPARCGGRRSRRLHDAMHDVLLAAVGAGGSTLGDAQYVDLMGVGGSYQDDHRVYGRAGERCMTCGRGIIRRTVSAGRSTHYCPWCQRLPRPLTSFESARSDGTSGHARGTPGPPATAGRRGGRCRCRATAAGRAAPRRRPGRRRRRPSGGAARRRRRRRARAGRSPRAGRSRRRRRRAAPTPASAAVERVAVSRCRRGSVTIGRAGQRRRAPRRRRRRRARRQDGDQLLAAAAAG